MKKEYSQIKYNLKKIPEHDLFSVKEWIKNNGIKILTDAFILDSPTTFQTNRKYKYYITKAQHWIEGSAIIMEVHQMDLLDEDFSVNVSDTIDPLDNFNLQAFVQII